MRPSTNMIMEPSTTQSVLVTISHLEKWKNNFHSDRSKRGRNGRST